MSHALQLAERLGVDREDPGDYRVLELAVRLPGAGEYDVERIESDLAREEADWAKTVAALKRAQDDANRVRLLEDYLRRHVGGFYRPYAQAALEKLRQDRAAPTAPSP